MSARTRLQSVLILPLLGLVIVGGYGTYESLAVRGEAARVQRLAELGVLAGALLHETQKERGMTAGYLGSGGTAFRTEIVGQRKLSDERIADFESYLADSDIANEEPQLASKLETAMGQLSRLPAMRKSVTAQQVRTPEAIGYYTQFNATLLKLVSFAGTMGTRDLRMRATAYADFLKGKERAGIERAVLANTFARQGFEGRAYAKFVRLVAEQELYLNEFEASASYRGLEALKEARGHASNEAVGEFREAAHAWLAHGSTGADPKEWFAAATARINQLKAVEDALAEELSGEAASVASGAAGSALAYSLAVVTVLALSGYLGWTTLRSVLGPLEVLGRNLREISEGEADLTQRLALQRSDEIGVVGHSFDRFAERIRSVIVDVVGRQQAIHTSSENLSAAAHEISRNANQMGDESGVVSENVGSLTESIDVIANVSKATAEDVGTMASAVEEVSANLTSVSDRLGQISESFSTAASSITELRVSTNDIHSQVAKSDEISGRATHSAQRAEGEIAELGSAAQQIGEIVETINSIAELTNLLALNATIEAASAGEAGRGFAVVANEVKDLAKQTADATDSIRSQVSAIQASANNSVQCISDLGQVIQELTGISSRISTVVEDQRSKTCEVDDMVKSSAEESQLATDAARECALGANEAAESIEKVAVRVREAAHQTENAARKAQSIHGSMGALGSSIESTRASVSEVDQVARELRSNAEELGQVLRLFVV